MPCNDNATRSFVQVPAGDCFCLRLEPIDGAVAATASLVDLHGDSVTWDPGDLDPGASCQRLTECNFYIVTIRVRFVTAGTARVRAWVGECDSRSSGSRTYCREVAGAAGELARIAISIRTVCPEGEVKP